VELAQRVVVREALAACYPTWAARLGDDHILELATLGQISDTALTRDARFEMTAAGLPNTFVPGRNLLFFTYAAALGYRRGIRTLVGGMCETDFSGYPDCRNETLQSLAKSISLGMDAPFTIETPLMWIDKAGTWALAADLGGAPFVDLIVEHTHTCYTSDRTTRHAWGYGCGQCPACLLRAKGWEKWISRP
jgi:7-cyano-7-deazaguanine synthase